MSKRRRHQDSPSPTPSLSPSLLREPPETPATPRADPKVPDEEEFCEAEFSVTRVDRPVTVVIVADKRVGKTTLAAALVMVFRRLLGLDMAIALTTSDDPTYFANILPDALIRRKAVPSTEANKLLESQRKLQAESADLVPRTCMVFDNVFFSSADFKGMTNFFQNAHNANILPIFTTTDPSFAPKQLQDTADFVFIARSMRHNTRKSCWKTFGDMYEKYEDFNDALARLGPHSFLVLDKTSRSRNLADIVSTYTPPLYRPEPITVAEANAFGKWHLLGDKDDEEDSVMEKVPARLKVDVHDHVSFEIGDTKAKRLCSSLGIVLDE